MQLSQLSQLSQLIFDRTEFCGSADGLVKGLGQFAFGFLGDQLGRKPFIVGGLGLCSAALALTALVGVRGGGSGLGFGVGAFLLGLGTTAMYSNCLAAVADYSDPAWRSRAIGTYRFWRDLGYVVGALMSGAAADAIGIPATIAITAVWVAVVAVLVAVVYTDRPRVPL